MCARIPEIRRRCIFKDILFYEVKSGASDGWMQLDASFGFPSGSGGWERDYHPFFVYKQNAYLEMRIDYA